MKKTILVLVVLFLGFGALFARGQDESAATQKSIMELPWDEVVAQAKTEGEVFWYNWFLQDALRVHVKGFEEEYGITVTIPDGAEAANNQKLLAERNRPIGTIDVLSTPGDATKTMDFPALFYGPITDVLPNGSKLTTAINGGDTKGYGVAYWGNQTGIAYDPLRVDESNLPQAPDDFAAFMKANPGKFGVNYEGGGSGPSFIQNIARNITGIDLLDASDAEGTLAKLTRAWDWFNDLEEYWVITAGNADSLTRINDGELVMAAAWEDHLAGLQKQNAIDSRIKLYVPTMGMNGGGNVVEIPLNAPHPAAALLFIDWLTSAKIQTLLNAEMGIAPQNPDADDSLALIELEQRQYQTTWSPISSEVLNDFFNNVIAD